jgi:hypothetical protein
MTDSELGLEPRLRAVRFVVRDVFQITGRGRCVSGDVIEGTVKMGMRLRLDGAALNAGGRVGGIEFADSPSAGESHLGLVFEDAPPLDARRQLLRAGFILVNDE